MPRIAIDLGDTYESVVRPCARQALSDVMRVTGIDSGTRVVFPGNVDRRVNTGSTLDDKGSEVAFHEDETLFVELQVRYLDEGMLTSSTFRNDTLRIFTDHDLGVYMSPIKGQAEIVISVRYKSQSRSEAERWISEVKRRTAQGFKELTHDVEYHYLVPREMIVILDGIHQCREAVEGYGETLGVYLKDKFASAMTWLSNISGAQKAMAIREKQTGILGHFNFEGVAEKEKEEGDTWVIAFDYTIRMDRPYGVTMEYPLVVHNQLLPAHLYDTTLDFNEPLTLYLSDVSRAAMDTIANLPNTHAGSQISGWSIPAFDDWLPDKVVTGTTTIARVMLAVDADNPAQLLNLSDLGDYQLIDILEDYLRLYPVEATTNRMTPILFTLYQDGEIMSDTVLTMDTDGNITTTVPLSLRRRYHLRMSMYNDLTLLSDRALDRLRSTGDVALTILYALEPSLRDDKELKVLSGNYLPKVPFWKAVRRIRSTNSIYKNTIDVSRQTVATCTVVSQRGEYHASNGQ